MSRWNLLPLGGFIIVVTAFLSYYLYFAQFPVTRDLPWLNLLLFALGLVVLGAGVRRAFAQPGRWFGKVSASLFSILSVLVLGFFVFHIVSFSAQLPASAAAPKVGEPAPDFTLPDSNNQPVKLSDVVASLGTEPGKDRYVLLVFYRGYWWPFCNSELRGFEKNLDEFKQRGVRIVAISVDSPDTNREHAAQQGYTYTFLSDEKREVIRQWDLLHEKGGPGDADISRPAEFLIDSTGTIRWVNLTENYRIRPKPEDLLKVVDGLSP